MAGQVFHLHGPTTINIYGSQPVVASATVQPVNAQAPEIVFTEKKQLVDPDYATRPGYNEQFLGVPVPLPDVHAERRAEMLTEFRKITVFRYHHYSLAMNKVRRLAMWTAVNVDYSPDVRVEGEDRKEYGTEDWQIDPRIPERFQVQDDEFYKPARKIDRGHIVRRDDCAWGKTFEERAYANADTYHWTNCTPQHERFNQSSKHGTWGMLEEQIKSEAKRTGSKLSIFAGPVLAADDPEALGLQYPVKFWKVVAVVEDQALQTYGFILDQTEVVNKYGLGLEMSFEDFGEIQCSLQEIEAIAQVSFHRALHEADVMAGEPNVEIKSLEDIRRKRR